MAKTASITLTERLTSIISVLQKVAMGDFSQTIEIPEKEDEFTELLVALNLMADDLKELTTGLEEKINEKTKILEKKLTETERLNKLMVDRELEMRELKKRIKELENK